MSLLDRIHENVARTIVTEDSGPLDPEDILPSADLGSFLLSDQDYADDYSEAVGDADPTYKGDPFSEVFLHGYDTGNRRLIYVDTSSSGMVDGSPFLVDADGLILLPRILDEGSGNEIESSDSARIYVRLNSDNADWVPMSFTISAQGSQKSDIQSITQKITKVWIFVKNPTQDVANQKFLILALVKGMMVSGGFGSAGVAGSQSAPSAGGAASQVSSNSGIGTPQTPGQPAPGPLPQPSLPGHGDGSGDGRGRRGGK